MDIFFAFLIKLTIIFLGSGIATLFAYFILKETSKIPKLICEYEIKENKKEKVKIIKQEKISSQSAFYEIFLPTRKSLKLFSSHKGIRIITEGRL